MLDEGFVAEARGETMQSEREEVHAAFQYAASFNCLVEPWKGCEDRSNQSRKKSASSWTTRVRKRSFERNGVRKQMGIDA